MLKIPRVDPIGAAALFLLFGAAAIPAFARGANSHPGKGHSAAHAAAAVVSRPAPVPAAAPAPMDLVPAAERGDTSMGISGRLRIHLMTAGSAPPGVYTVPGGVGGHPFAFIGVVPFDEKHGATIGSYRVGFWPAELHALHSYSSDIQALIVTLPAQNARVLSAEQ